MADKQTRKIKKGPSTMMKRRTLILMAVCGIVAFLVLAVRLFKLQIIDHDYYETLAVSQQVGTTETEATRGTIYDTNLKTLAMTSTVYNVFISPAEMVKYDEDPNAIATEVANLLDIDSTEVYAKTKNTDSWYEIVAKKVDADTANKIENYTDENNIKSVHLESAISRYYPYGSLASHVIGFVGSEGNGLGGIEYEYNSVLTATGGKTVRSQTASGQELLFTNYDETYASENGYNVVTTLDSTIQYYIEKRLEEAVDKYQIRNGAGAIVMNVKTGAILGMASLDNFDLNDYLTVSEDAQKEADATDNDDDYNEIISEARQLQWRNKCLSDTYEPGSTFKIITLASALQEGTVDEDDEFDCTGSIMVTGDTEPRKCWNTSGHGVQTLTQAVQHSCNVAFVEIGQKLGAETFYKYCDAFGFLNESSNQEEQLTAKTGIDLPGEASSIWWSEKVFFNDQSKSQLAAASFGQTFTITPLQLITAVSAAVNGGYLMEPYVVRELTDASGNVVYTKEPTTVRQVVSEETSEKVCEILEKVVNDPVDGTGKNAYVAGYRIGGKTATSEKVTQNLETGEKDYIVSFIGVAPIDDPEIAVLVFLDSPDPDSGIYISGGQMAAPTVGEIMSDILPYLGVEAQYSESESENMDRTVPSVTDKSLSDAESALTKAGFNYRIIGDGSEVTNQLPAANSVVATGSTIILYADENPSEETEEMVDLTGMTYADARDTLSALGIYINTSSSVNSPSTQLVETQNVEVGEEVKHGAIITVTLQSNSSSMLGRY